MCKNERVNVTNRPADDVIFQEVPGLLHGHKMRLM